MCICRPIARRRASWLSYSCFARKSILTGLVRSEELFDNLWNKRHVDKTSVAVTDAMCVI